MRCKPFSQEEKIMRELRLKLRKHGIKETWA
jgi:hypothetical protein